MTTIHEAVTRRFDVEALPDYEAIKGRFEQDFQNFVSAKKYQAARIVLKEEIPSEVLASSPDLIEAVVSRLDEEALLEKRYIFLSLNPEAIV